MAHTSNIQLNLVYSLSDYLDKISSPEINYLYGKPADRALEYIMLMNSVNNIMRWTVGKAVMVYY